MGLKATGERSNTIKLDNNAEMNSVDTAGVEDLMDTIEEVKPCWTKPSPNVVVVARYLGATFVLPDIRGNELGNKRKFQDMYNVDKFVRSLDGVVEVIDEIPDEVISLRPKETSNKNLDATACLAMFSGLELKHEYSEVARKMLDRLQELSKKSDWKVLAIVLEKKSCKTTSGARRKGCYNPDEVLDFLRSVGFSANTTIYLTETWWHKGLNDLKEEFPNTYTKDDIMPAENKGEFLKSSNVDLARALDLEICSQSDMFIPAVAGLFYEHVTGKRIASGRTQIIVPSQSSTSTHASDLTSTYISNKNHLAYTCYC
uniref:O-fucosyltransferase family protein n=1 Tax=Zea mays TaxID=4577 RepID=A0A804R002_MAIZE